MAADDLLHWRSEFPILANTVYLVSHSLGAMPRRTRDRLAEYADVWATRGVRAWGEGWWELPRTVGDLIGRIIGAGPGEVVMHQNQSIAQATVLSAMDWRGPRNGIVTERLNFPSNLYLFHALSATAPGSSPFRPMTVITVPLDRLLAAIDETHAARLRLARALQERVHPGHRGDDPARARCGRPRARGPLPIGRHASRSTCTRSAPTSQPAARSNGCAVARALDISTFGASTGTRLQPRLTGWMAHREPFAFEDSPIDYAERRIPLPERNPERARSVCGAIRLRDRERDRRRRHSGEIHAPDGIAWSRSPMRLGYGSPGRATSAYRGGTVTLDVPSGTRSRLRSPPGT